jgi:LysR family transcriptional regulator, cys regulon transcriptional activator
MNFRQLRILRETVRCTFNLTEVANVLLISQSGVSKHVKDLEDELGVELFVRRGKRLLGLTEPGKEALEIVGRILLEAETLAQIAGRLSSDDRGILKIATTHTQARYTLPPVIARFKKAFPNVRLILHQASPKEIPSILLDGDADIGIATDALEANAGLITFPYYSWEHAVIVRAGHELESVNPLTLEAVAEWPIITYDEGLTGRTRIDDAFARAGLAPDIAMSALDADVIKAYVELELGVGIIASIGFDPARDTGLRMLDCTHLFASNTSSLAIRRGRFLRGYTFRFIELCSPQLTEKTVRSAMQASPFGERAER